MARDVETEPTAKPGEVVARLCNFETGVKPKDLLPDHKKWLRDNIVKPLRLDSRLTVRVTGLASHRGDNRFDNNRLSKDRAAVVKAFLERELGTRLPTILPEGVGSSVSGGGTSDNDGLFRAVVVRLQPRSVPGGVVPVGLSQVTVWINAFINKDVKDGKGGSLTFKLIKGLHAGKSVIPGPVPLFPDCYMTDNRDFDSSITASSRIHAEMTIDFTGPAPVVSKAKPKVLKCDPSIRLRISDGEVLNTATGHVKGDLTPVPSTLTPGSKKVMIQVDLASNNPVARGPMLIPNPFFPLGPPVIPNPVPTRFDTPPPPGADPDIDIEGTITIDTVPRTVEFSGKLDRFPFFEMYASKDGGMTTETLFRIEPTPGDTPANLFGKANRDVTTLLGKPAKVTL